MECKICSNNTQLLLKGEVLNKYEASYLQCNSCKFIQVDKPYWLDEAYNTAITSLDIGLVSRNIDFSELLAPILHKYFGSEHRYLDYGGGYGLFVRLMRDKGLDFYRFDTYCDNLFAKNFDIENLENANSFNLITAFELFEHLENPLEEVEKMFALAPSILFSTLLQPNRLLMHTDDWWYFMPETGQHIGFYTYESLERIAQKFNKNFYSNGTNLHLFTDKELSKRILNKSLISSISDKIKKSKKSLLQSDYKMIKEKIKHQ